MPASAKRQRSTERVVVRLRAKEKRQLAQLAKAEQVSSAEILRRSLRAYAKDTRLEEDQLISELNAALDRTLASIAESRGRIAETLDRLERQRTPPEVELRLNGLYEQALVEQSGQRKAIGHRRKRAA